MFTIAGGVFLTSKIDAKFDTNGFLLISTASLMAGLRWAYIQFLLRKHSSALPAIGGLCLPISIMLFIMSAAIEGIVTILRVEFNMNRAFINISYILISGCVSFALLLSEFVLVEKTSVVYLSMAGIVKELTIVLISVIRREITLNYVNSMGLMISIAGIILFNFGQRSPPTELPVDKEENQEILTDNNEINDFIKVIPTITECKPIQSMIV